jgi:hypothetical protein
MPLLSSAAQEALSYSCSGCESQRAGRELQLRSWLSQQQFCLSLQILAHFPLVTSNVSPAAHPQLQPPLQTGRTPVTVTLAVGAVALCTCAVAEVDVLAASASRYVAVHVTTPPGASIPGSDTTEVVLDPTIAPEH